MKIQITNRDGQVVFTEILPWEQHEEMALLDQFIQGVKEEIRRCEEAIDAQEAADDAACHDDYVEGPEYPDYDDDTWG